MTPPSEGYRLMRNAVLSLCLSEDFCKNLLHWRTARPYSYVHTPLNSPTPDGEVFAGGPAPGAPALSAYLAEGDYLRDHFGNGFQLLCFAPAPDALACLAAAARATGLPVTVISIAAQKEPMAGADVVLSDPKGVAMTRYDAEPGTAYLLRPDLHVCARWRAPTPARIIAALRTAIAGDKP